MRGCTIRCAQSHFEQGECPRKDFAIPRFGERFAGVNYPLTMAVALAGGAVQRPLGLMIADNSWDYFSEPGKDALEFLEEDPALRWRHWSPDSFSFTATLRRAGERKGKGKRKGHARLRTENQPWGVDRLSRDDQVIVRQENKMAKRCLKGLEAADRQGGFAALLHPYDSLLWRTEEVEEIRSRPGSMVSSCSFCCFGVRKASWISLLHNSPRVHQALHHPRCHCARSEESGVHPSSGRSGPGETGTEEYPWRFCVAYAGAVVADLRALMIPPLGTAQFDLPHLLYNQIMGSARGMQSEDLVYKLVVEVEEMVRHMELGDEQRHLAGLARHLRLKGTDARLLSPKEETNGREVLVPYPAFRWNWRSCLAHEWPSQHGLRGLEMVAMLAELRRRARSPQQFNQVYIHVVDSVPCLWAVEKGRSKSRRVNRTLQRFLALAMAANIHPLVTWTLTKWSQYGKVKPQNRG